MKKTIIVLALALLMICSVFAANAKTVAVATEDQDGKALSNVTLGTTGETESTKVEITLKLHPKYAFGITDSENMFDAKIVAKNTVASDEKKYTELPVVETIPMDADYDDLKLKSTADGAYYVSYWFYECNEAITLNAKIDGAMEYQGSDAGEKKDYIDFQAVITATSGVTGETTATIKSDGKKSGTDADIVKGSVVNELGKTQWGNMKIVLGPRAEDAVDNLKTNVVGNYLSTITLTLKADK